MHIERIKSKRHNKVYESILLRQSYREKGQGRSKVKHRTILNLTKLPPKDVQAIEIGLKYKNDLAALEGLAEGKVKLSQGRSVGALWLVYQVARRIGLVAALGGSQPGRRALWQVMARLLEQGSRLSAVRLAQRQAACEVLGLDGFNEDDLYGSMDWLDERQSRIEKSLYKKRGRDKACQLFLYDVTSSYLEGEKNAYGSYGYNRDGKKGKKQIVVGLLTDGEGVPLSVEVFEGNASDPKTVSSQIRKMADRFGAKGVTMVGDRGMIKSAQIEELNEESFHYITAITKPQIESLLKEGVLQMELFEDGLCEVEHEGVRYILRRNPERAKQMESRRRAKYKALCERVEKLNEYLTAHPRADVECALRKAREYAAKLLIDKWAYIELSSGRIVVGKNESELESVSRLDGCYVIKTDLSREVAEKEVVHARYKDLSHVERAFREMKTDHLELRPVYVRTPAHTRAHVFVVMLAYRLRLELERAWGDMDLTVEEGLRELSSICAMGVDYGEGSYQTIPRPGGISAELLGRCGVELPSVLPCRTVVVATKKKVRSRSVVK